MVGGSLGRYDSPLRYPGGKGKLVNFFKLLFLKNGLIGVDYVEPYAGGASVALSLLFEDFAEHVHINDLNPGVHAFWDTVLNDTDALCDLIESTEVTVEQWLRQREVQRNPEAATTLELGFSTFFLNRTNRSGIISGGGLIGGLDQTGPYKIDARYTKAELIKRIRKVSRFRSRVSLTRLDAIDLLRRWRAETVPTFLYLDPPYFAKGEGLYDNFYRLDDHRQIAELVLKLPQCWAVSYDAAPEIAKLYAKSPASIRYRLPYSAADRHEGYEVMFFSQGLRSPTNAPAQVASDAVIRARRAGVRA